MKTLPEFIKKINREKYNLKLIDLDIEKELNNRKIPITSWGRLNLPENKKETHKFTDDLHAAKIIKEIVSTKISDKTAVIIWTNANIAEISCNIDFIKDFSIEITIEDWDFWIIGENWIIEKYHEGEVVFFKNQII
ncbi:hypothetical protein [Paracidovorax avenae]|uniref:hypothetical protein n=1 Tax=Paracidovorax avenae TaxID=80867 RepID=UPI000A676C40|nr:hypothetical protein [Paracidovorax avenae]